MGKNDFAVWEGTHVVGHYEIHGRSSGFVWVVEHWLRAVGVHPSSINGVGRVDEDDCFTTVELRPDWVEIWMTEVVITFPVACEKCYAVSMESIESVCYFLQA